MVIGFTVTPWLLVLVCLVLNSTLGVLFALFGLVMVLITEWALCDELDLSKSYILTFPLGGLVLAAIMLNSMVHVRFRNQSVWRGRAYSNPS